MPEEFKYPGFLRNLPPDNSAIRLQRTLQNYGTSTQILTKVPLRGIFDPISEKKDWLAEHAPQTEEPLFCPEEISKAEMVRDTIEKYGRRAILIDDWNKNLREWDDAGGTAVKYLNGNNNQNSWNGWCLDQENTDTITLLNILRQIDINTSQR